MSSFSDAFNQPAIGLRQHMDEGVWKKIQERIQEKKTSEYPTERDQIDSVAEKNISTWFASADDCTNFPTYSTAGKINISLTPTKIVAYPSRYGEMKCYVYISSNGDVSRIESDDLKWNSFNSMMVIRGAVDQEMLTKLTNAMHNGPVAVDVVEDQMVNGVQQFKLSF